MNSTGLLAKLLPMKTHLKSVDIRIIHLSLLLLCVLCGLCGLIIPNYLSLKLG